MNAGVVKHSIVLALSLGFLSLPTSAQESLFRDEFNGTTLHPSFRIINPDKDRMAFVEGDYLLVLTHAEKKNILAYSGELPDAYVLTVRIEEPPAHQYQAVRLRIGELDNNVRVGMWMDSYAGGLHGRFYSVKTLKGDESQSIQRLDQGSYGKPFYLRISRSGVEYSMAYSFDGATWKGIGKQVFIGLAGRPHLEIYNSSNAPESPVKIDSFEITELLP